MYRLSILHFRSVHLIIKTTNNKQLLDEVEHDIVNYQNQGLCLILTWISLIKKCKNHNNTTQDSEF